MKTGTHDSVRLLTLCCVLAATARLAGAVELTAVLEHLRPDPFGGIVAADSGGPAAQLPLYGARRPFALTAARNGYASFHLVVKIPETGAYRLNFTLEDRTGKLQADIFREWFHFTEADKNYYPDALVPISMPYSSRIPAPDNCIERQVAQAFWVDIWIPADAAPSVYAAAATLEWGKKKHVLPVRLTVLPAVIPAEDVIAVDHNSYGSSWLGDYYPGTRVPSEASFRLTHLYHRLFYEHRGVFHQLGYGHGGKVIPEFAPELAGSGKTKRVANWDLYDRHYGPLLDGSAFAGSRRGPRPIPFVYLPVNPEWPASFLWWGEPGYEVEFTNVMREMEKHFREKGWTRTSFEVFFNHKKRYKAFPWDGDETRFPGDDKYFIEYGRLLKKALPADSPVKFRFRTDTSWSMERQFKSLAGVIDFWVCGGGMFSWYEYAAKMLKDRGGIVWIYGGAPAVTAVSSSITEFALRVWLFGIDGWVHWLTTDPGKDPWFHFGGGGTALAYPGTRFGIEEPIPSVRLKIQRNCLQDLALLDRMRSKRPLEQLKAEAARRFNGTTPAEWWTPRPRLADTPPHDWTNADIDDATKKAAGPRPRIDAAAWQNVRAYILELEKEEK
ncbi:MAG: hypothetical protein HXY20_14345 [Acidobacteria bacterium]|nr:hypothetical protein [Acidobacteriota bacterium]